MVSNGSHHYDHDMDGTHTSLSGCQANIRGQEHETFVALRYEHNQLMVCCRIFQIIEHQNTKKIMHIKNN